MAGFLDDLPDLGLPPPQRPGKPVTKPDRDVVTWTKVYCPRCGSADCPVIDSHAKPVRWHQCKACSHKFKSVEINYRPAEGAD